MNTIQGFGPPVKQTHQTHPEPMPKNDSLFHFDDGLPFFAGLIIGVMFGFLIGNHVGTSEVRTDVASAGYGHWTLDEKSQWQFEIGPPTTPEENER